MTDEHDDAARAEFEDAKRSIDSLDRASGDEAVAAAGLVPDEAGDDPERGDADADLGLTANDELTDGDAVR
jgi:hypothetical protein